MKSPWCYFRILDAGVTGYEELPDRMGLGVVEDRHIVALLGAHSAMPGCMATPR